MKTALLLTPNDDPQELRALTFGPVTQVVEAHPGKAREALDQVRGLAAAGTFEILILKSVRIVGVRRLLETLTFLAKCKVRVVSVEEPFLDLENQGEVLAMLNDMLADERRENLVRGQQKARHEGRPPGRPRAVVPEKVFEMAAKGCSLRQIARATGLGASTVGRALQAHRALNIATQKTPKTEVR